MRQRHLNRHNKSHRTEQVTMAFAKTSLIKQALTRCNDG